MSLFSSQKYKRVFFGRWSRYLALCLTVLLWSAQGCTCETEEPPVSQPEPEISLLPSNWTITEQTIVGQKIFQTFTIRNSGKNQPEDLNVESIQLIGNTEHFKIVEQCKVEKPGPDDNCVNRPSLPDKVAKGGKMEFTVMFTASDSADLLSAEVRIVSNAKNEDGDEKTTTVIRINAQTGEPYIDIGLEASGDTEFRLPFSKVEKGKTKEDTFTVTNVGNANLEFQLVWENENKSFSVVDEAGKDAIGQKIRLTPSDNREFTVKFKPESCGEHEVRLLVKSNAFSRGPDSNTGASASAPTMAIRLNGKSPVSADASPSFLEFGDVKVGESKTLTFQLGVGALGVCDLEVSEVKIDKLDGQAAPKYFKVGEFRKGGSKVSAPSAAAPITIGKGEKLEVDITFSPTGKGGDQGVVKVKTNDSAFDSNDTGVVTLTGGAAKNLPPAAGFEFICKEGGSACTAGANLGLSLFLSGERRVVVELDGSKSFDLEKKITNYEWKLIRKPRGSAATIQGQGQEKASFVVTETGKYVVELKVTDDESQSDSVQQTLNVQ